MVSSSEAQGPMIVLSNGQASIKLAGPNIFMNALGDIHLHAGKEIHLSSAAGTILIQGGPNVNINPADSGGAPSIDTVTPALPPLPPTEARCSSPRSANQLICSDARIGPSAGS